MTGTTGPRIICDHCNGIRPQWDTAIPYCRACWRTYYAPDHTAHLGQARSALSAGEAPPHA